MNGPINSLGRALLRTVLKRETGSTVAQRCGVRKSAISALLTGQNHEPRLALALALQDFYGIPARAWIQENARPVSKSTRVDFIDHKLIKEADAVKADYRLNRAAE